MIILWYTAQTQLEIMMKWKLFYIGGRLFHVVLTARTHKRQTGRVAEVGDKQQKLEHLAVCSKPDGFLIEDAEGCPFFVCLG